MNSLNYFDNREDCKKFLDGFDFEYFIPYSIDWIDYNRYSVQLNKECTEVVYCSFESVENGLVKDSLTFFDIENLKVKNKEGVLVNAFPLAQSGESLRRYVKGRKHV
jgi:hypothetical protein